MKGFAVFTRVFPLVLLAFLFLSCKAVLTPAVQQERSFSAVNDFLYQLQNVNLEDLAKTKYDLAVIDYSRDGSADKKWKASEIAAAKAKGIFLLAYLSIGEAENYRSYWQSAWEPGLPSWLGKENPDWKGNFKVKYWDSQWKSLVKTYLAEIVTQGFDGVYLDVVDAYEYWADVGNGESETLLLLDAADKMTVFVKELADYSRKDLGKTGFLICPQNGTGLIKDASPAQSSLYLDSLDAVGAEDTYFFGDQDMDNIWNPQTEVLKNLDAFSVKGKKILAVEYLSKESTDAIKKFYQTARLKGFVPFATNRDLDVLRINTGFEPD